MKRAYFVSLFLCLTLLCLTTSLLSQSNPVSLINRTAAVASPRVASPISASQAGPQAQARILEGYGKLPLSFEANHGQADARVKFLSRTGGYTLFLTGDEAVLAWSGKKTKETSAQRLKPSSLAGPSGTAEPPAQDLRFVSGYRFSDTASPGKPDAPSGAGQRPSTLSADPEVPAAGGVLRMKLRNANPAAKVTGEDELAGTSNYFIGNDPAKWRTKVPTYAKVKYEGIYPGIDLVYYGNQRQLEYDFIVAPGADPHRIAFDVRGAKRIRRDARGDLVLTMKMGEDEIRWHKPLVYQERNGTRQEIAAHYAITDTNRVGFELAKYDAGRPLYIDPLIFSTYLGGSGSDGGSGIAVDSAGNAYVIGSTSSTDFPTKNPLQSANAGGNNAFVTKINPGSALVYPTLVYSTYLGGSGNDFGFGIAVDSGGNAYVTGGTSSTDFPTTPGAFQTVCGGCENAFVAKINPTGSALVYSTYLGGSGGDSGRGIAVDSADNAYVAGFTSTDFPTKNPLQATYGGNIDAFVAKINPTGSALVYSTYLGGSGGDYGYGIAVDGAGNAYVTGLTSSTDFPTKNPLQATYGGGYSDAFVAKVNPTGSALVYSTYLGGPAEDYGAGIAADSAGNAYVNLIFGGDCIKCTTYPYVDKINPTGSALVYSTNLYNFNPTRASGAGGIAVDSSGSAYVVVQYSYLPYIFKLDPGGSFFSSTHLGGNRYNNGQGIAADNSDRAYVTGSAVSTNFPTKRPLQAHNAGNGDAFVTIIDMRIVTTTTLSSSLNPSTYGQAVTFTATVKSSIGAPPDGQTVTFMKGAAVLGTGTLSAGSTSFTTSALPGETNYIEAAYGGDTNFAGSTSKAWAQDVYKATTTTTLTSSLNPSNYGQSVTFTASVTPQYSGTVKGTVTFYDGTTVLKTVGPSGGVAKYKTSTLTSGSHSITATFNGGTNFLGSSASLTQTVH